MGTCVSHESISAGPAIGIDFRTTFSCAGVTQDNKDEIIANGQSHCITPSLVTFTDKELLTDDLAKKQDVKRLIGRRLNDETMQGDMKRWPFKVINSNGQPKVKVKWC
ncbi:unnamed protein product, partial [Taenia asiatica]|uniref:Heat shock protein 70 family n=1 Tax=Taenia asiatica TaxID=60517 RepID=A0A0R3WGV7_TAEAS